MRCKLLLLLLLVSSALSQSSPFEEGPYTTKSTDLQVAEFDHDLGIFAPNAPGVFPVVYFAPGFIGTVPPNAYAGVLNRIASHGYAIISPHHPNATTEELHGEYLVQVDQWCRANLLDVLWGVEGFDPGMDMDFSNQYLMGHSSGCHALCEYLSTFGCSDVKGFIMLSPVDGVDPFGIQQDYCTADDGSDVNFDIPALIVAGGLDSIPGINATELVPACAPEELSNRRFFNAMSNTVWMVNTTAYGHGDLLEPFYWNIMNSVHFCAANQEGPSREYRNFLAGEVVAFLKGINEGQCEMLLYLEDPNASIAVELSKEEVVSNVDLCIGGGFCDWTEEQ